MYFWTNIYLRVFCDFVPKYIYQKIFDFFSGFFSLMHYFVTHESQCIGPLLSFFFIFIQETSFPTKIFSDPLLNFLNYNLLLLFWSFWILNIFSFISLWNEFVKFPKIKWQNQYILSTSIHCCDLVVISTDANWRKKAMSVINMWWTAFLVQLSEKRVQR